MSAAEPPEGGRLDAGDPRESPPCPINMQISLPELFSRKSFLFDILRSKVCWRRVLSARFLRNIWLASRRDAEARECTDQYAA
jgi:hypothetical protein